MNNQSFSFSELKQKAEQYCAYQERCHQEVTQKLYELRASKDEIDQIIVQLITDNFLNEERFARSYARGKHRIKKYGKVRIVNELKFRNISSYNIKKALEEISDESYFSTFAELSEKTWSAITERNKIKKKKKFCDMLLRKGYESDLVYQAWKELSKD
ncbi:MAG TPA: regulatory protein RecX [Flavobacterium sp.]|nr:regulatory protein RecX [Flavobacterium sp.]